MPQKTMSFDTLPTDALALVLAHLSSADRFNLVCTSRSLREAAREVWRDVFRLRYGHCTIPAVLRERAKSWGAKLAMRDAVDDYFCHESLPWQCVLRGENHVPFIAANGSGGVVGASGAALGVLRKGAGARVETRDTGRIASALRVSPDGLIAVGGLDKAVVVYDARTLSPGKHLRGHTAAVTSLAFVADSNERKYGGLIVASGSADRTIRLHRVQSRRSCGVLRGHNGPVSWVECNGAGLLLSHGSSDGRLKLWDVERVSCVDTGRPSGSPITHAILDKNDAVVYASSSHCVHVMDLRTPLSSTSAVLSLPRARGWAESAGISALALSETGELVAGVGGGGLAVWDACGPWQARPLGWPGRWGGKHSRRVRAVLANKQCGLAGGGAGEILSFGLDGGYEGLVAGSGGSGAVVSLVKTCDGCIGVGRDDGSIHFADLGDTRAVTDWNAAASAAQVTGVNTKNRFWQADGITARGHRNSPRNQ